MSYVVLLILLLDVFPTNEHNRISICNTSSANTKIGSKDLTSAYFCCNFNLRPFAPNVSKQLQPLTDCAGTGRDSHSVANMYCAVCTSIPCSASSVMTAIGDNIHIYRSSLS